MTTPLNNSYNGQSIESIMALEGVGPFLCDEYISNSARMIFRPEALSQNSQSHQKSLKDIYHGKSISQIMKDEARAPFMCEEYIQNERRFSKERVKILKHCAEILLEGGKKKSPMRLEALRSLEKISNKEDHFTFVKSDLIFSSKVMGMTELRHDKMSVMKLLQNNGAAFEFVGEHLRDDEDVFKAAFRDDWKALKFAGKAFKDNEKIVSEAMRYSRDALNFATPRVQMAILQKMFPGKRIMIAQSLPQTVQVSR